jgi:ligand-binding sensor domain-containing protein
LKSVGDYHLYYVRARSAIALCLGIIATLTAVADLRSQQLFEEGDWVSYRDYRWVYSLSVGPRQVYVGTSGGVIAYSRYSDKYDDYWARTTGYDVSEPLDSARVVAYSDYSQSLWCGAEAGLFQREEPQNRWRKHDLPGTPMGYRVLSIGVGQNYIWVEAGPPQYWWNPDAPYAEFFLYEGSPFSGGFIRFKTGFFQPPGPDGLLPGMENVERRVTWYGRLGRVPLNSGDLLGLEGVGRYDIPILFPDMPGITYQGGDVLRPGYFQDSEFRDYPLTDWTVDDRGVLWLGTWGLGLGKANLQSQRVSLRPAGLWGEDVDALEVTPSDIWIGGMNDGPLQGITHWQNKRLWTGIEARYTNGLESTLIYDMAMDNRYLWVATAQGLSRYDLHEKYWATLTVFKGLWSDVVLCVSPFLSQIYIGTNRGLNRINQGVVIREENWFRNLGVNRLTPDGDTLWAANDAGMYKMVAENAWEELTGATGTVGPKTVDIAPTHNYVWFARRDGVEGYHRSTGEWKSLLTTTYFDGQIPTCCAADDSNLWVGTERGLYQFNILREVVLHHYEPKDGLLGSGIRLLQMDGKYLWIGTNKGLCHFYWDNPIRGY